MNLTETNQRIFEINSARQARKLAALSAHMGPQFPTTPMQSLQELQHRIDFCDQIIASNAEPAASTAQSEKQFYQAKINNNEYCSPGSTEWDYKQAYILQASTFVWPTTEESALYAQEDDEISDLIKNITFV